MKYKQQGFSLVEGVISLFLVCLIGLGITYSLAHLLKNMGPVKALSQTDDEIRAQMQSASNDSKCSEAGTTYSESTAILSSKTTITTTCTYNTATLALTVDGTTTSKTVVLPSIVTTDSDTQLGAGTLRYTN